MESKNMGYSMPLTAPIYNEPPYFYRGGNILLCVYRTKEEILKQIIPQPLKPAGGNLVYAWINDFGTCYGLGPYREAIISVPAEFQGQPGNYMVYLYLDRDTPIAAGREIWGFPKKMGRFSFSKEEEVESRAVERGGVEILRVSMQLTKPGTAEAVAGLGAPIYNLKVVPSVKKGAPPDVSQLTANTLENIVVHSVVEGNATVSFGISPADPLYLLEPVEIIQGIYCELDFDLTYGEVIHDYIG